MTTELPTTTTHPAVAWLRDEYLPTIAGNLNEAERQLGISEKTLRGLLRGNYQGNAERQLAKLDEQRQLLTTRAATAMSGSTQYIPTEIMQRIWTACDYAKAAKMVNMVVGVSQIGKTTAARAYRARYPETTLLVELMPKPTISSILHDLAEALHIPGSSCRSLAAMRQAVKAALSPRHIIIIDEAHLALDRQQGADALDMVRRLHDLTGCAVVLLITHIDDSKFTASPHAGQLDQLRRRGLSETLPPTPSAKDVALIWHAFQLPQPTPEIERTMHALARKNCFGTLLAIMRLAVAEARMNGSEVDLDYLNTAMQRMGKLSA